MVEVEPVVEMVVRVARAVHPKHQPEETVAMEVKAGTVPEAKAEVFLGSSIWDPVN